MSNVCVVCHKVATQSCSACGGAFYCCRNHQKEDWKKHKFSCVCYEIKIDENLGRCIAATRDIKAEEVIMKKKPLVLGPKTVSCALCLGCHKKLNLTENRYECKKCHWPVCDEKCENSPLHEVECDVLLKVGFKADVKNDKSKQTVYAFILPLRALLLKRNNPKKFDSLLDCQSHLDKHLTTPFYQILKRNLVPLLTNVLKINTNEDEVLTLCSIFDTNCFEVKDIEGLVNVRGLYPMATFLSHDCKPNTKHSFHGGNFEIVLTATVPIKKGELITATYTQTLWGTLERRSHLKFAKNFDCICKRCKDPTEFGTYLGSFKCEECRSGKILSLDPLDSNADWECANCGYLLTSEEIVWRDEFFKKSIIELDKTNPENLEMFLDNYKEILHESNSFCLQIKYALNQLYGKPEGLSEEFLDRKISLCRELLQVAESLEPGYSTFRVLLLKDLHKALTVKNSRNKIVISNEEDMKYFQEAEEVLKF